MMTGLGYADGVRANDRSMPAALWHAMELIDDAQQLGVRLGNLARKAGGQS